MSACRSPGVWSGPLWTCRPLFRPLERRGHSSSLLVHVQNRESPRQRKARGEGAQGLEGLIRSDDFKNVGLLKVLSGIFNSDLIPGTRMRDSSVSPSGRPIRLCSFIHRRFTFQRVSWISASVLPFIFRPCIFFVLSTGFIHAWHFITHNFTEDFISHTSDSGFIFVYFVGCPRDLFYGMDLSRHNFFCILSM